MIYKFCPILKTLIWGTESWVLSGVQGNESVAVGGPCEGKTVNEIYGGEFPLLIKFIDAHDDLSIQVHPDDALAARRHGCKGKTEMWYVIGASEGAHLLSGLSRAITPDEYVSLVEKNEIVSVLSDYKVSPGDVFFLPAGRIHAIGGGCYLAEVQQTSNITYRIYDYGRLGLDGRPRQLHTEEAKDAIDYTVYEDYRTHYVCRPNESGVLVSCPFFTTSLCDVNGEMCEDISSLDKFLSVICMEGSGRVNGEEVSAGEVVLLDPSESSLHLSGSMKCLTASA